MLQKPVKFRDNTASDRTCRRWFDKFEADDFELNDKPWCKIPHLIGGDIIGNPIEMEYQ